MLTNNWYISYRTTDSIFNNYNNLPKTEFSLLLGSPKYLPNGDVNNYYKNRIIATVELYKNSIVDKIIISADTLNKYGENEIELIYYDLIQNGINEIDLILDKNGNRTWNSIIEEKKVGNQRNIILISQRFHLERAIYIALREDLNAIGFVAKGEMSNKLWIREVLARAKMHMDILTK